MPENIIDLDSRRSKKKVPVDVVAHFERLELAEETLEAMDELGVTTRAELVALLESLEASAPEIPE
ncbi:MAG: hypothetical protein KC435_14150 [Thermomicrobiales bacterium]|nr:hypothetical protein [Thermomicrobiales bacterium]